MFCVEKSLAAVLPQWLLMSTPVTVSQIVIWQPGKNEHHLG